MLSMLIAAMFLACGDADSTPDKAATRHPVTYLGAYDCTPEDDGAILPVGNVPVLLYECNVSDPATGNTSCSLVTAYHWSEPLGGILHYCPEGSWLDAYSLSQDAM